MLRFEPAAKPLGEWRISDLRPSHQMAMQRVAQLATPMDTLFKIVGIVVIVGVGLIGLFVAVVWMNWNRIKRSLQSTSSTPSTIHLVKDTDADWVQKGPVKEAAAQFEREGFEREGAFSIVEMTGVRVLGFTLARKGARACIYDHPAAGNWIDLCATTADGKELTISNALRGGDCDTRPDTEKVFLPGKTLGELLAAFAERIRGREPTPVTNESFEENFVSAYARDMAWRNARAGMSEAEFRRVAARGGKQHSEEHLAAAFKETKLQELQRWSSESIQTFEKQTAMTVSQWREYEYHMIIFREDFHCGAYLDYLGNRAEVKEEKLESLRQLIPSGITPRQLLERISKETGVQFVRLGAVESPLRVEIFGVKHLPSNGETQTCTPSESRSGSVI